MSAPEQDAAEVERLDSLVAEGLDRLDRGGEAELTVFLQQHPSDAPRIASRIDDLRSRGLLQPGSRPDVDDAADSTIEPFPDRLGEFRLLRRLGSGGMGVVYLAEQEPLKRLVALKVLQPSHLFIPRSRERFQREIETVARLQHPGIVPIYTVGEAQGVPYFAMALVDGCNLADVLREFTGADPRRLTGADLRAAIARLAGRRRTDDSDALVERGSRELGEVSPRGPDAEIAAQRVFSGSFADACLRLLQQAAEALAHAHARGVLHRDVKPSNIMVTTDGSALMLDFGLALMEGTSKLTGSGGNPGSLPYMSPEQLSSGGSSVDARTDVYALGVTLYEMLALRPAFEAESGELTRRHILEGDARPVRVFHRGLARDVDTIVLTAMQVDPGRRYATMADLARDLERAREGRPIDARRPGLVRRVSTQLRRQKVLALAIACVLLAGIGSYFFVEWRTARGEARTAQDIDKRDEEFTRALQHVLDAAAKGEPYPREDLAKVMTYMPEKSRGALALVNTDPLSSQKWEELEKLMADPYHESNATERPLEPRAGIYEKRPLFRFDVEPPDDHEREYVVTVRTPTAPDRVLELKQGGRQEGPLEARFDAPFEIGVPYVWSVRRKDAGEEAPPPVEATFEIVDQAMVMQTLPRINTGDEAINVLTRTAVLLDRKLALEALKELTKFPTAASPESQAYRLLLESHAHALLAHADTFATKRAEAAQRSLERSQDPK